jgi:hypothetical protein
MRGFTRVALPLLMGALGGALVLLVGGSAGSLAKRHALAGGPLSTAPAAPAEPTPVPMPSGVQGPTPDALLADVLEVSGKTRPAPGRRALIAPVPLHPVT